MTCGLITVGGLPLSGRVFIGGNVAGGSAGGGVNTYGLFYGGAINTSGAAGVGKRMRSGGVSNSTTFTGADAGSEWPVPSACTLDQIDFARTNASGDTVISIDINGVASGTTITILTGNLTQRFTGLGLAIADLGRVSLRFASGGNPDFTSAGAVLTL